MKLASLPGGRDGRLAVVSDDLKAAVAVERIAPTMQAALDDWGAIEPKLREVANRLNMGEATSVEAFDPTAALAPLPRAYQFCDASAYLSHVERVRRSRGAEMPPSLYGDPLMYQAVSDPFLRASEDVALASEDWGIDLEGEVAVITDAVPMGVTAEAAGGHVKLLMLLNDVSLRGLIPGELAKGFGFLQGKPASSCSPVAATPDSLGEAWRGGKLHLPLACHVNGELLGRPNAGDDMNFDFATLIAHAARTRRLGPGTVIGSGTVSNKDPERGFACLSEKRTVETLEHGAARTPFLRFGDRVRIEMLDAKGRTAFGAIDQKVVRYERR